MNTLMPVIEQIVHRGVTVHVLTWDPQEDTNMMADEAEAVIERFEAIGVHELLCRGNDHRKLAIINRNLLWEGSLNILSQTESREIMRRINDRKTVIQMLQFLKFEKVLH